MKKILLYLGLLFFLLGLFLFFNKEKLTVKPKASPLPTAYPSSPVPVKEKKEVSFYNKTGVKIISFEVEIADTPAEHEKGLMYRDYLAEDRAMLFIFEKPGLLSFWMKNTLIPLDIIYISQDKKVVSIIAKAQPCPKDPCPGYSSQGLAQYVLEINGGLTKKLGIEKGTEVKFNLP